MRTGSLFSGYGGLEMAVNETFGATTAWVSDIDKGACKILAHRYPDVPNLGDITAVDWSQVEPVDIRTLFGRNVGLRGGVAPVRAYIPELLSDVATGRIDPSPVFDLHIPLAEVAEGYAAMDERRAIKVLLRP